MVWAQPVPLVPDGMEIGTLGDWMINAVLH
jgi:hypothetical protein